MGMLEYRCCCRDSSLQTNADPPKCRYWAAGSVPVTAIVWSRCDSPSCERLSNEGFYPTAIDPDDVLTVAVLGVVGLLNMPNKNAGDGTHHPVLNDSACAIAVAAIPNGRNPPCGQASRNCSRQALFEAAVITDAIVFTVVPTIVALVISAAIPRRWRVFACAGINALTAFWP